MHGDGNLSHCTTIFFVEWPARPQVDRGAYVGKMFVSDTHANQFFDLCKQVGGPRLLPSKPRGRGADLSLESNGPVASVHRPSSQDVDNVEVDATKTEGQVCEVWT